MLDKITELWEKLWESIPVFRNKDKVKSPHVPTVEGLPSDDTTLKPDKKKPEEHLTLLSKKQRRAVILIKQKDFLAI